MQTIHFGAKPKSPEFYHWYRYAYIDKTGAIKIPGPFLEARPFTSGLAAVMLDGKWGYIDKTGKSIVPCQYDWAGDFTGDLAPVEKDMLVGYIDKSGKQIIPFKFKDGREFADGLAPATLDARRWGYIDTSGVFKIEPVFQRAFTFNSGEHWYT
ncbi:MAG: WG repeat-containing protein [Candidatus Obscuribacter sp.]|nr:WG repeat-containing protein [Candidatus Obscuribacter sp.]